MRNVKPPQFDSSNMVTVDVTARQIRTFYNSSVKDKKFSDNWHSIRLKLS